MKNSAPNRTPQIPWSRRAAFAGVAVFAVLAAWPYLSATSRVIASGQKPTAEGVKKQAQEDRKKDEMAKHAKEIKAVAAMADGRVFLGNKGGLAVLEGGAVKAVDGWPGGDVRHLAAAGSALWAVGKEGVWKLDGGAWQKAFDGEAHSVAIGADQTIYLGTKTALKRSRDGVQWEDVDAQMPAAFAGKIEHGKKEHDEKKEK